MIGPSQFTPEIHVYDLKQAYFEGGTETFHVTSQVLNLFPSTLQTDIYLHIHDELFSENSAFRAAVPSCRRSLATKLRVQHFLPRQYVAKQGDEVDRVFFIVKGIVHVVADGHTILALGKVNFSVSTNWSSPLVS